MNQLPLTPPMTPITIDGTPNTEPITPEVDSPILRPRRLEREFRELLGTQEDPIVVDDEQNDSAYEEIWNEIIDLTNE